jgi:hypothetical protein
MKDLLNRIHAGRRSESLTAVEAEDGGDAAVSLQPELIDIEIHAVDAFDRESHVFAEDFGDRTW